MNGDNTGGPGGDGRMGIRNYMSDAEAKSFHGLFIMSFLAFTVIAIVAHILVWNWRPWAQNAAAGQPAPATTSMLAQPASTQHS